MPITRRMRVSLWLPMTGAAGDTTTTDSRSKRNRASRRGGQLQTRAHSSSYASACPHLSRMVAPYAAINLIAAGTKGAAIFIPVTNAIERLHEEFKRRIKTQTVLPSADTAAMLFWALLASGQIVMRKIDGWNTLSTVSSDQQKLDAAA